MDTDNIIERWGEQKVLWVTSPDWDKVKHDYYKENATAIGLSSNKGYIGKNLPSAEEIKFQPRGLIIPDAGEINCDSIREFCWLKYISLHGKGKKQDLSLLHVVEELRIDYPNKYILPQCKERVERVYFYNFPWMNIVESPVCDWRKISHLEIVKGKLESLKGVSPALKMLSVAYLNTLTSISDLRMTALEELEAQNCKNIDFRVLSDFKCLTKLIISNCGVIGSVRFVESLENIKYFSFVGTEVSDGNLNPLLKIPYVAFSDKKHYTHKNSFFS